MTFFIQNLAHPLGTISFAKSPKTRTSSKRSNFSASQPHKAKNAKDPFFSTSWGPPTTGAGRPCSGRSGLCAHCSSPRLLGSGGTRRWCLTWVGHWVEGQRPWYSMILRRSVYTLKCLMELKSWQLVWIISQIRLPTIRSSSTASESLLVFWLPLKKALWHCMAADILPCGLCTASSFQKGF